MLHAQEAIQPELSQGAPNNKRERGKRRQKLERASREGFRQLLWVQVSDPNPGPEP